MVPRRAPHVDARRRRVHAGPRLPRRVDGVRRPQLRGDDGLRLALLFAGLYCLARGSLTASSPIFLALGGLALGLAVAARPSLVIAGVFVALAAVLVLRAPHSVRRRGALHVALLAPTRRSELSFFSTTKPVSDHSSSSVSGTSSSSLLSWCSRASSDGSHGAGAGREPRSPAWGTRCGWSPW